MALHVVVGAGPIGSGVANLLADAGEQVRVVTRSGGGPERAGVERVAADASDAGRMRELVRGSVAVYNCANPPYHRWPTDWPPIAASLLAAAEDAAAVLAIASNLYAYGPVDGPMTEHTRLAATGHKGRIRAQMWLDALAAHEAGRVRATEARASDYLGSRADSIFTSQVAPALIAGRTAWVPASLDVPHSFTYTLDMARTLVAIAADERAWGRPWHVPTPPPLTIRELSAAFCRMGHLPAARLRRIPRTAVRVAGLFSPLVREFGEVSYQFERPFVLDSSRATQTLGLVASPLDAVLADTLSALRHEPATAG